MVLHGRCCRSLFIWQGSEETDSEERGLIGNIIYCEIIVVAYQLNTVNQPMGASVGRGVIYASPTTVTHSPGMPYSN